MERIKPRLRLVWPPSYLEQFAWRQQQLLRLRQTPSLVIGALEFYKTHPVEFIEHWGLTIDPRNAGTDKPVNLPFILFPKQKELIQFLQECIKDQQSGLVEKSRDMGATWLCCAFSVWLWLFWPGATIGWCSRVLELVDIIGVEKTIFEKMRIFIRALPPEFLPKGFNPEMHLSHKRLINPANGSVIYGEGGDNVGRGGRTLIYFKDESAWYEHPELIEAALTNNTNCQIDLSSVHGVGTVFNNKREAGADWYPGAEIAKGQTRIFVLDWRDHPGKTQEWYDTAKRSMVNQGLGHIWAQEVDRNYSASVTGTIIPSEWLRSCVDAHIHLKSKNFESGGWGAALDVAGESGSDTNALAKREGNVLRSVEEWGGTDTSVTTKRAVAALRGLGYVELQFDSIGVGEGVKGEANRLAGEGLLPKELYLVMWNAGASVLNPEKHMIPGDRQSPKNEDFYENLKAQGWWELRRRCELTHRARTEPDFTWDADDLISIDSRIPLLNKLLKELSQPTMGYSSRMKMKINKQPDGAKSPNLADAVMMCYWPMPSKRPMKISADVMRWASQRG